MASQTSQLKHLQPIVSSFCLFKLILVQSVIHLKSHLAVFGTIFFVLALPLSLLLLCLISSSRPMQSQIFLIQTLSVHSSIPFESWEMWKRARQHAISLFRLKLIYFVPCSILSLVTAVTTVSSVSASYNHRPVALRTTFSAVRENWYPPILTSICSYVGLLAYSCIPKILATMLGGGALGLIAILIGSGFEMYLAAVVSIGIVISIAEKVGGWPAIIAGWELMEEKRICGLAVAMVLVLSCNVIEWRMESILEDGKKMVWARATGWERIEVKGKLGWWEWPVLLMVYAIAVVWGYAVSTIFYCECKKRQVTSREEEEEGDDSQNL